MTHLLLGLDPKYLREEPYIPTVTTPPKLVARELDLHVNPQARVHCLPSVGSYVGGDITAGVISSGLFATDRLTLFIDIGTNGEIVLGTKDWLIACACSAGPAFEGGGVDHGMRASTGAIEDVWINAETFEPTLPHGRQRAAAGHLRQRSHRPAGRAVRHRPDRQGGPHRPLARHAARCARASTAPSTSSPGSPRRASDTTSPSPRPTSTTWCAPRRPSTPATPCSAAASASTWPRSSRSSSAAPSASTSTSRRRSGSACCPTCRWSASTSWATPAPSAPTRRSSASTAVTTSSTSPTR